jgi:GNAT superfamily N-acetyltransferase
MWAQYCAFYETVVAPQVSEHTWSRIVAPEGDVRALIAASETGGDVVGFANYVVHPFTWGIEPACYLEDLFVRPEFRGTGAGRALIDALLAVARANRWSRVYWMTRETNTVARRLYDRYTPPDDFIRYSVPLDDAASA